MTFSNSSKPKILVVDDEPDNLDLLYRTFHREYRVLRAESGQAALAILAEEEDIAVIISDQRMPSMSGTEFLSLTATQYPDIIRIILTGYTDVEDLVEAINTGKVFKYVTKPWNNEELKAIVQQGVDTHNVLKARTKELYRTLRQESLLNTVTKTIRSTLTYSQILQTLVDTVGYLFEVSFCVLRPFHRQARADEWFVYEAKSEKLKGPSAVHERLADTVWETQEVQNIDRRRIDAAFPDTDSGQRRQQAYEAADIHSSLLVPLICKQELMAVLALHQCGAPRDWEEDDVDLLSMVASQAALALSQAWAYERVQALAQREALTNTITTAIRSSLDPRDIFAAITEQLGQALKVDSCAFSLWTETDEFVECVGLYDATAAELIAELPKSLAPIRDNPILQQLLDQKQPVAIDDLSQFPELGNKSILLRTTARSLLLVPLLTDGQLIGSISLCHTKQPRQWQDTEIELAQAVAAQAAIAVQQGRLYQQTRQQAEKLLELDRQKTEFFQNISHEFRTPLTLTISPLESVVNQQQGLNYDQSVIALRSSRRLLRLVNQLLDLQRLDAKRMQPVFQPCDLVAFIQQVVETCRPFCDRKGLNLVTQLQPCPTLYLDVEKFEKVLYNLLSNAMKFTPPRGKITVVLDVTDEGCQLQVSDTGIGIPADQLPHLFERFRQAEGSTERRYEGSGLGLALSKELVELHSGRLSVASTHGQGTTFTVSLQLGQDHLPSEQVVDVPTEVATRGVSIELADLDTGLESELETPLELNSDTNLDGAVAAAATLEEPSATAQAALPSPQTVGMTPALPTQEPDLLPPPPGTRILVVDDHADLRTYLANILQSVGYEVLTAHNGANGLTVAQAQGPQLIITDLMMPVMSGLELIQRIRTEAQLQGIPVILLTAKADEESRVTGTEYGADAYLSKPFNDRELLAEVRNLLALKANERKVVELNTYLTESVLGRFLPPSLVHKAARGELALDLRPDPRLVTIVFSDIIGFTQISNTLRSRRVAELLNDYLEAMTEAIFAQGGTVDKFMGDAVLAIFGAPETLSPNEQVQRAIAAARQMYAALETLNARWREQGIAQVKFRCGIHQGTAVVGMFGSQQRADYTAIGPSVNIAARIQEAAEPDTILVSAAVADYLAEEEVTKFSPLHLKGVDETVLTFGVKPKLDGA